MRLRRLLRLRRRGRRRAASGSASKGPRAVHAPERDAACLDALDRARRRAQPRRVRDEDGHAAATRGEPAAAHRGDRRGMLNSIGLANPGREPVPGADTCRVCAHSASRSGSPSAASAAADYARDVRAARRTSTRSIELNLSVPERRRGARDARPRSSPRAARRRRCRSTRSSRPRRGTSARPRAPSRRPVRTGSRSSTRMRGLALDEDAAARRSRAATGGLLGPALKPIALAAVYALRGRRPSCRSSAWAASAPGATRSELIACRCDPRRARNGPLRRTPMRPARPARARVEARRDWIRRTRKRAFCDGSKPVVRCRQPSKADRLARRLRGSGSMRPLMVPPQSQVQAPVRSLDQRMEALQAGQRHPGQAAQLKKRPQVRRGVDRRDSRATRPEYVSTAKVFDMLMAVPKFGRVKAARLLNQCRISQSKTVGGLSDRQRQELIDLFNRLALPRRLRRHRPVRRREGTMVQASARRVSRAASSRSRRRRAPRRPDEGDGVALLVSSPTSEFDAPARERRVPRVPCLPLGPAVRDAASELDRIARGRAASAARARTEGRSPCSDRIRRRGHDLHRRAARRARAPATRARHRKRRARSRSGSRSRPSSAS